ncbi:T9SS-dependent M36 family metallopeptidase [Hymenobacter sp. HD11105]
MRKLLPFLAKPVLLAMMLSGSYTSFSQGNSQGKGKAGKKAAPQSAVNHIKKNKQKLGLEDKDIADLTLSSETDSKKSGVKHLYVQQQYEGIEVYGAITTVTLDGNDNVISMGDRLHKHVGEKVKSKQVNLNAEAAVAAAAKYLNLSLREPLSVKEQSGDVDKETLFSTGGISLEPIPAKLVYQPMEDGSLMLAWEVAIYELDGQNWWNLRIDAANGNVLDKHNLVLHCEFDNNGPAGTALHDSHGHTAMSPYIAADVKANVANTAAAGVGSYNVFAMPLESPSEGPRSIVSGSVADKIASPSGWHSTGTTNYTTTRGNNVFAYEDPDNTGYIGLAQDTYGYSPEGGSSLNFDFPLDFTKQPVVNRDAAITNLFYWNNLTHDIWYRYGFDEQSGNFQTSSFGRGPADGDLDHVMAEAQDARNIPNPPAGVTTRNNANFATTPDGQRPRMQMYLWSPIPDRDMFQVTAPADLAKSYLAAQASFGPRLKDTPVTGKLVLVNGIGGTSTNPVEGCGIPTNAAQIQGNIAVVYRGNCDFSLKVYNAQAAGAIAVVVINNVAGNPVIMPAGAMPAPITIPSVMISNVTGAAIREKLNAGVEVRLRLKDESTGIELDGDFDNGIIAHEYGHGISTRLAGGRLRTNCLQNAEQMGEGWSDWFGLMMTMKEGDTPGKVRGIGTYVKGEPTTGLGIRPAPYSTDFAVNNATYATTNLTAITAPHGVGFVWSTMLWDMTWDLIAKYGFDKDLYNGKGGNNMAMQLVIDGLKLQDCSPGFVDGRNGILLADRINYGGAHQELIWKAFAKRGLGFSASQGLRTSRFDQVQAFDLPPTYLCTTPLTVTAVATSNVFTGSAANVVYLGYGPQTVMLQADGDPTNKYTWTPADGLSDATIANPVFTPTAAGTYTFTVKAVNTDLCTKTASITITVIDVRCGKKNDKVQVCQKQGNEICISAADVINHLRNGGSLGTCGVQAKAAVASAVASDALSTNDLTAAPNPTNANTTLAFTLAESGAYRLEVMNMQGAVVAVVAQGKGEAGQRIAHEFSKGRLATGVYMVRLTSGKQSKFTRVVLQD